MANHDYFLAISAVLPIFFQVALCGCYFPLEFQGEFLTQSMTSRDIAYTSVSIFFDSIPSWGKCHRRMGHNVILQNEETAACFKCLSIVARSKNVLQIHTRGLERCYPTEQAAIDSCPSAQKPQEATEMMLYKTRGFYGESAITRTYCPLNGRYKFTYSINDGTEDDLECNEPVSEAGDCPTGYKFDLHFKGCSFPDFDMSFQCLASWPGENGETYLSLLDTKLPQLGEEARPRYRCALFKEDPSTGLTHMALSSDSTCVNRLFSSQDGYETLHLQPEEQPAKPVVEAECDFPGWMQGTWEGLEIKGGEVTYRDETNFVTYHGKCMTISGEDRYLIHSDTDCGAPSYNCIMIQPRDKNAMEFKLGLTTSEHFDTAVCMDANFPTNKWITVGREDADDPSMCPLVGEYTGVIPDAEGLCAKSYADCNNPEVMFYTVYNCHNASEVFEERIYRCFGQWEENGLVYTYTERRDLPGFECFVGVTIDENRNVVTEAGANCERGHQPRKYGMTLHRQAKCSNHKTPFTSERPVSPRLSTVQQTVFEYPHVNRGGHQQKPHRKHHRPTSTRDYQDIYTNEISSATRTRANVAFAVFVSLLFRWLML